MNKKRREEIRIQEAEVESARKELVAIIAKLKTAQGKYQDICECEQTEYDERSEKWQESENGIASADALNCLENVEAQFAALFDMLEEVEKALQPSGALIQASDEAKGSED